MSQTIETLYVDRVERFSAAQRWYASRERLVMNLRVATFLVAAAMTIVGWNSEQPQLWYVVAVLALAGFVAAVAYQEHFRL